MTLLIGIILLLAPQQVRIGNAGVIPNAAMVPPTIIKSTMAPYSAEAANRGLEGAVTLEARVDVNGRVEVLRVLKSLGFGLDENAVAAVKGWVAPRCGSARLK
jgi:TonB family protein